MLGFATPEPFDDMPVGAGGPAVYAPPPFVPRAPWWTGDLQTLRNFLVRRRPDLAEDGATRLTFALDDGSGDALVGTLNMPAAGRLPRPLAVLIHGLTGCESSSYMLHSAAHLLSRGHRVLRLNLRGAGPSRALCQHVYHAGRTGDLAAVLSRLDPNLTRDGVVLVGYSLGANMLLKFLAEYGRAFPVRAAASVSAPIDLAAASRRMMAPRNRAYQAWLLARMKHDCTGPRVVLSPAERRALALARTVWEFDDGVVAPSNGYADAAAYYADNAAARFLRSIPVPTLVIHAADDPWIPHDAYQGQDWAANPHLMPALTRSGGHVGFHGAGDKVAWHDRAIADFFAAR